MVRRISVGFQAANRSIKEVDDVVPAAVVPEAYSDASELRAIPEVRRRPSAGGPTLYVKVSNPYDDGPLGFPVG